MNRLKTMSVTINDLSIYIFCWKKCVENSCNLYNEIKQVCPNVTIINSDENQPLDNNLYKSIQLDDTYYYGGQLETALSVLPTNCVLWCITGDIQLGANWTDIISNAIKYMNRGDVGIYTPRVIVSEWQEKCGLIEDNVWRVDHPDRICLAIHPQICEGLKNIKFKELSNYAFAIDKIFTLECHNLNMIAVCDYSLEVKHPDGSGYDRVVASAQMNNLLIEYNQYKDF